MADAKRYGFVQVISFESHPLSIKCKKVEAVARRCSSK